MLWSWCGSDEEKRKPKKRSADEPDREEKYGVPYGDNRQDLAAVSHTTAGGDSNPRQPH